MYSFGPGFKRRSSSIIPAFSITPTNPGGQDRIEIAKVQNIRKENNKISSKSDYEETKTVDDYGNNSIRTIRCINGNGHIKHSPTQSDNRPEIILPSSQNGYVMQGKKNVCKDNKNEMSDKCVLTDEEILNNFASTIPEFPVTKYTSSLHLSSLGFPYTSDLLGKDSTQKSEVPDLSGLIDHISVEDKSAIDNTVVGENSFKDFILCSKQIFPGPISNGQCQNAEQDCIQSYQDVAMEMKSDNDSVKNSQSIEMQSVEINRCEKVLLSTSEQKCELIEDDCHLDLSNVNCSGKLFEPNYCRRRNSMEDTCGDIEVDYDKILVKTVSSANMMVEPAFMSASDSDRSEINCEIEQPQNCIADDSDTRNRNMFLNVEENFMGDKRVGQTQVDVNENYCVVSEDLEEILPESENDPDVKSNNEGVQCNELLVHRSTKCIGRTPVDMDDNYRIVRTDSPMGTVDVGGGVLVHDFDQRLITKTSVSFSTGIRERLIYEEALRSSQSLNAIIVTERDMSADVDSENAKKLRCEEDLQARLMQCTDFDSRKIRAAFRELKETAPQIFEKWRKANCDSIIHQNFTPSSDSIHTADTKSRSETDYNSFKDLDSLRLLLTEAKDQNEKRRIRHAMRQLRERERNRQSHGLKNCAVNGRISSLSRSQSLIDDKVQVILQAENNWKLPDKRLVSHSSSFTCGLTKQERKPDSKKDFFNESLQDHTINSSQIRRWCSRSDRSERRKKFVKDESRDRDPKIPLEDNIDSCRPTGYQILSEVETSQLVDNTVPARCTCAEVSSVPSSASKIVSILSETLDESEPTRVNPEFNDNRSSKSLNFNNTSKTDISKKHEIHSHSSILNVMLKHSPNYRRRNSESVYVKKKHAPKKSLPINQSSDQEFQDWLEDKKRTLVLPGLGFDDLNSTREMEAAFSDILDEVDNHSDASDYTSVTCPLEEMRVCRGNPEDILEEEIVENKLHRKKVSYTKQVGERHEDIGEKLEKKVGLKQLEGLTKDVIANNLVIHGDNRECNNNIRKDHVLKHNMVLDLTRFQDKNSAISVIEDDGSVIIQQVTQKDEGNKVVTEVTKLRRTESCTEEEEKDKIIESRGISNEGASVYQKDITKTKKKLTARGSEYFSRNNTIIKRIKKRDGPEYLQHNVCIENDNFSATKGESWGDRAFTQVQLNRSVQQAVKKDQDALNHLNVSKTNSHYRSEEVSVICPPAAKPAGSPEIVCPLKDVTAPDGSTCCLMCVVRATPAPTITWYQNGDQLDMLDSIMTSYDEASGETVLEISAVTSYQSGEYRCVYRNLLGEAETAARLTVNTSTIPVFTKGLQDVTVDEGQSAILECCVPDCKQIFWYKDGTKRRNSSDFKQTYDGLTARLEISELIFGDGGEYACMGKNEIGETMTVCRINVKECLFESVVVPTFLTKPCSQIVGDHEQIVIECEVIGSPPPKVIWLKDGQEIVCNTRTKASFDGRVAALKIGRACLEDSGKYDCVLDNSAGRVSADAILIVRERKRAPFIVHELSDATVVAGKPFTFHCSIMGNPRPTILWRKDHCMIGDTKDFHQSYNDNVARLEVSEIYEQDGGFYECVATNNLGEAITNCHLCIKVSKSKPIESTSTGAGSKQENAKCTKQTNARQDFTSMKVLEHSDLIPEQNSKFQQADTVTLSTAQITSSKYKYQRDNTVTSYAPKINSERNKFTEETQNSKSCDQKSNCINSKTFMSWQAEPIKNSWTLRRTESLKLPQKSDSENREILVSHRIGSDENIFKSPSFHCKLDGINKFEKIMQTEQKPKPWQGVKLRRTESARLPSKESPSPLWKNLMVRNTKFSVDKFDQEKPVEVRRSTPRTKLLFECKASADDEENAFSRLVAEVTPLEKKGVALTRTSSLKILPTRKQTGLSRSGSLKLPENEERSAVSSLVAQKRQFWEASSTKMPSYEHIMDEEELHKLLSQTENIEERKKIRGRMRELHEIRTKEWEKKKEQREIGMEDAVRKRFEQAELAKKRQLQAFQDMAAKPTSDRLNKYSSTMDEHIREKHAQADADKKKTLEAYDRMAAERACGGKSFTTVSTEKVVGPVGAATKKSETSVSHQFGIGGTSYGRPAQEIIANQIARQLIGASGPNTGGQVTVKMESWNSRDGIVERSQKTESWGAKPVGGFTGMSPQASGGTNRLATPGASGQGRGGSNITRNPSAIKQLLLEWSKSKVVGYENVNVTNFSSSWNTGMAFCALIHHFYPEAFDFNKLNPKNRRYNFNLAFDTAEKYADIAPLLDTDDMVKMKNPDWKCVFTYIQSFYRALRDHD